MPTPNTSDEAASRFRALLDALPDPVALVDRGGSIIASNAAWSELAAEAPSDAAARELDAGSPWPRVLAAMVEGAAEDHAAIAEGLRSVAAAERSRFDFDLVYARGGEARCLSLTFSRFPAHQGGEAHERGVLIQARRAVEPDLPRKVEGSGAAARDVTQSKLAEIAVYESEERFRLLSDLTSEAVVLSDRGQVFDANASACELFGWSREEIIGRMVTEFVDPECHELIRRYIAENHQEPYEAIALYRDRSKIPVLVKGRLLPYRGRMVRGTTLRDLRLQKLVDETIRQQVAQEAQLEAQAATLAELSTPLIPISDDIVVMPLIGAIDTQRAEGVVSALLDGVQRTGASIAILDITGVPTVDTRVADALVRAARAVRLIGAEVVLTGIRPEVAQTLVTIGADLSDIPTRGALRSGIAYALTQHRGARAGWDTGVGAASGSEGGRDGRHPR